MKQTTSERAVIDEPFPMCLLSLQVRLGLGYLLFAPGLTPLILEE